MSIMPDTRARAQALREQLIAWRRDFHRHPELGYQEVRTAGIVAGELARLGYRVQEHVAHTGVVGLLEGARPGPVLALRFDMDGLPIAEENEVDYASESPGLMHACGHDAHLAIGLGVASLVSGCRDALSGTLKLIFQPAEEGPNGAEEMVRAGVLEDPRPDLFLAGHVWSKLPVGTVAVSPGPVMAAPDRWQCTVRGRGGHGAQPHETVDPIVATAHIITALQTIVSRNVDPLQSATVTVSMVHGGQAHNIVPAQVELTGTMRTFEPAMRELVQRRLREVSEGVAGALGATAEVHFVSGLPAVVNDDAAAQFLRGAAMAVVGESNLVDGFRTMGSEDAALFLQAVPGCYFFLGAGDPARGLDAPHHNPHFDIAEDVLPVGVAVFVEAVARYLSA